MLSIILTNALNGSQFLVVYFHESHAVTEWRERMGTRDREAVAACHDAEVARVAKQYGFKDVFYAKQCNTEGLQKTVNSAIEFAKSSERMNASGSGGPRK